MRTTDKQLNPGDLVVGLAALVQSSATLSGAVVGAGAVWLTGGSWSAVVAALFAGGLLGFGAGFLVARALYHSSDGQTTVVRVGVQALPAAIPAGLAGGLPSAFVVAAAVILLYSAPVWMTLIVALLSGTLIGVGFAFASSLT